MCFIKEKMINLPSLLKKVFKGKANKGFTLIEVMASVLIFSIVVSVPIAYFVFSIKSQKETLAKRETIDSASYVTEYMSRILRMAKKDLSGSCIPKNSNYEITARGGIRFENYHNQCQEFYLDGGQIKEEKTGTVLPLTPTSLEVTSLRFHLSGENQSDNLQPLVTIFFEIRKKGQMAIPTQVMVQTSVSQRQLDVLY